MNEFYFLFLSLGIGIAIDLVYGDPSNKYHPVAWLGKIITLFIPLLKGEKNSQNEEKLNGMIFAITLIYTYNFPFARRSCYDYPLCSDFKNYYCDKRNGKTL
jgi:cobalamin biosynthesis protein CobD/CbiB